jgi:hypothetical protein
MEQYTTHKSTVTVESLKPSYTRDPLLERAVNSINRLADVVETQRRHIVRLESQLAELRSIVSSK